jgi:hypothetical protein
VLGSALSLLARPLLVILGSILREALAFLVCAFPSQPGIVHYVTRSLLAAAENSVEQSHLNLLSGG